MKHKSFIPLLFRSNCDYFWNCSYYFTSFHSFQKCPFNIWKTKRAGEFQEDELGSVALWTETHVMNTGTFPILPLSGSLLILHRLETVHQRVASVISPMRIQCSRTLKCRRQVQSWGKLPPKPAAAFIVEDWLQWLGVGMSIKVTYSQTQKSRPEQIFFSEKILRGAKRMTLRNVCGSFLTPECFQGVNLGWSPIIAIHRLVRCQVLQCMAF